MNRFVIISALLFAIGGAEAAFARQTLPLKAKYTTSVPNRDNKPEKSGIRTDETITVVELPSASAPAVGTVTRILPWYVTATGQIMGYHAVFAYLKQVKNNGTNIVIRPFGPGFRYSAVGNGDQMLSASPDSSNVDRWYQAQVDSVWAWIPFDGNVGTTLTSRLEYHLH